MRMGRILTCLLLGLLLVGKCFAAETELTVSDAQTQPGKTVYLTVTLNQPIEADTVGISYSYDAEALKPLPDSCSWSKKGMLQDFNAQDKGVWTTGEEMQLKGELCTLAFRVLDEADFSSTEVHCTVVVKNGAETVAEYQAKGTVTQVCAHTYGKWEQVDEQMHRHTCSKCGAAVSQSHSWSNGTVKDDPQSPGKKITEYQCSSCGGKKTVAAAIDTSTLFPQGTQPETQPETLPTLPTPTLPVKPVDPTASSSPGQSIEVNPAPTDSEQDHDHTHTGEYEAHEPRTDSTIIFVLVMAMLISGAILIVRKKK